MEYKLEGKYIMGVDLSNIECLCGNKIKDVYNPNFKVFEYVGCDGEKNSIFKCIKCKEFIYG